jgi:hypothetical protein
MSGLPSVGDLRVRLARQWRRAAEATVAYSRVPSPARRVALLGALRSAEAELLRFRKAEGRWPSVEEFADGLAGRRRAP